VRLHVVGRADDFNRSAGIGGLDSSTWTGNANRTGGRVRMNVTLGIANINAARNADGVDIIANVECIDRAACRTQSNFTVDVIDPQGTGRGIRFYWSLNLPDRLRSGRKIRTDFRVVRNFNLIRNGDVVETVQVFSDANG